MYCLTSLTFDSDSLTNPHHDVRSVKESIQKAYSRVEATIEMLLRAWLQDPQSSEHPYCPLTRVSADLQRRCRSRRWGADTPGLSP